MQQTPQRRATVRPLPQRCGICDTHGIHGRARSAGDRRVRVPEPADQRCLPFLEHRVMPIRKQRELATRQRRVQPLAVHEWYRTILLTVE